MRFASGFARAHDRAHLGARRGLTKACGSAACAAAGWRRASGAPAAR
jgi:hypothetical protein